MRKILVRGKRVDNGEWVSSGNIIHFNEDNQYFIPTMNGRCTSTHDINDNVIAMENAVFYKVIPETVGQYIGKCDKHGNKIFTGQIVKYKRYYPYGGWETHKGKVDFDYCSYILTGKGGDGDFEIQFSNIASEEVEIIGNIHDNPELLKEGV